MKKWSEKVELHMSDDLSDSAFTERAIFFDIETTGFSRKNSNLYMIGCVRRKGFEMIIDQFFAESAAEEKQILSSFLILLEDYDTLFTFHGMGFDIPYLKAKCDFYQLEEPFSHKTSIDFYKIASHLKFLLKLPNYKQKSLETFFGICRMDTLGGGELIQIYKSYVIHPSKEKMLLLKQHNYDDLRGMVQLLPLLHYMLFLDGGYSIASIEGSAYTALDGKKQKMLLLSLRNHVPLPKRVSCRYEEFYLICNKQISKLSVRLFDGELNYFFKNYQDYYYLPKENTVIHKDIASFVAKEYRKKATASNCCTSKSSLFVPQYENLIQPVFQKNYKDKKTYFELSEEFTGSEQVLRRYIQHILKKLSDKK